MASRPGVFWPSNGDVTARTTHDVDLLVTSPRVLPILVIRKKCSETNLLSHLTTLLLKSPCKTLCNVIQIALILNMYENKFSLTVYALLSKSTMSEVYPRL